MLLIKSGKATHLCWHLFSHTHIYLYIFFLMSLDNAMSECMSHHTALQHHNVFYAPIYCIYIKDAHIKVLVSVVNLYIF